MNLLKEIENTNEAIRIENVVFGKLGKVEYYGKHNITFKNCTFKKDTTMFFPASTY